MNFKLQFEASKIHDLASKYNYKRDESPLIELNPVVQKRGYLTLKELKDVCEWKTSRSRERVKLNREDDVNEITKVCFETTNERLRIGSLLLLEGVEFPTASVILHFFIPIHILFWIFAHYNLQEWSARQCTRLGSGINL